ncbi:MAG: ATP-binding protein [Rhizobiales bacterium]|nr:ATP-binding protein [Hyphomicrobiales bacterium]
MALSATDGLVCGTGTINHGQFFRLHLAACHRTHVPAQTMSRLARRVMYERHLYIIGKSGSGKSTFLQNIILQNPGGFCLIDPHGDLAEAVADRTDCIYFDPSELPLGFNVFENVAEASRPQVAAQIVASFKAIWGDSWGPRMEWILVNALRLLLDNNQTFLGLPKLLTDDHYRARLLRRCTDPIVRTFWEQEFDAYDDRFRKEAIAPIQNKVGQLLANPLLRNILGQHHSTLRPQRIMDRGQRIVVNLAKGKLGDAPSHLLGALLVSAFAQAAEKRASIAEQDRVPFTLYVDEFQNFATESFANVLSEARKFKLSLVIAHQFLGQLPDYLRQAVFGNVGTMMAFRVGAEDAPLIALELGLKNAEILSDLDNFRAWLRVGGPFGPQIMETEPGGPGLGRLSAVRSRTRARYCRPSHLIEREIESFINTS